MQKTNIHSSYNGYTSPLYENISFNDITGEIKGIREILRQEQHYNQIVYYVNPYNNNYAIEGELGHDGFFQLHKLSADKYIYKTSKSKGLYIKNITDPAENKYPSNGIKGDYWYERIK